MKRHVIWVLILVLASFGVANAQETTSGSLGGTVTDAQGANVPGATVVITSAGVSKQFTTDSNGRFFAPFLPPACIRSGWSWPASPRSSRRRSRSAWVSASSCRPHAQGRWVTEVVEVQGSSPVVDTSSTTIGGILDSETIARLPVGRAFTDTLYMLPGVSDSSYAGASNPSIGGASGLENNFIIDGVNASNAGFGAIGSYSATTGRSARASPRTSSRRRRSRPAATRPSTARPPAVSSTSSRAAAATSSVDPSSATCSRQPCRRASSSWTRRTGPSTRREPRPPTSGPPSAVRS